MCRGEGKVQLREPSAIKLIRSCIKRGHESVIEHVTGISVRFICDRGVSHELVRHRLTSVSMESTRYCNYSNDKFGGELTFVQPPFFDKLLPHDRSALLCWQIAMQNAENSYLEMLKIDGCTPELARSVLPHSIKTELVVTANVREWRLILKLRTDKASHPQMRQLMVPLLNEMKQVLPVFFEDM